MRPAWHDIGDGDLRTHQPWHDKASGRTSCARHHQPHYLYWGPRLGPYALPTYAAAFTQRTRRATNARGHTPQPTTLLPHNRPARTADTFAWLLHAT
ncbi:MAG: hypothetical protein IPI02_14170 [Sterolibacteriaceae bacterium]|nr:hypothetical protein [Sterolibacteriaceae bacterium]